MPTITHEGVDDNLRFLILEVRKQVLRTRDYLADPSEPVGSKVFSRDDYIDNLKDIIQRKCYSIASDTGGADHRLVDQLKAIESIAINLERIADFCENILSQIQYITDDAVLTERDFGEFFSCIITAVDLIEPAIFESDVQTALKICRAEYELDRRYSTAFRQSAAEMEQGGSIPNLMTVVFIYRYLERMGDSLQNIGESVISYALGEKIKIDRFWALEDSLESSDEGGRIADVELEPVGETRSGCKISRVHRKSGDSNERQVIFKEGRIEKLAAERDSIEEWQKLVPGLVPQIYSFHEQDEHASILFEYISGQTFEDVLLNGSAAQLQSALERIRDVQQGVWRQTKKDEPAAAGFLAQLAKRLSDVYAVHPEFRQSGMAIGAMERPSLDDELRGNEGLDDELQAPFSVFIHGDFNVDNIIFDQDEDRVHLIDVNRSRYSDYVQDVSVFVVSNMRLQVFESPVRRRINSVVESYVDATRRFASENGDATFDARLGLGLARSFATSARFVLDSGFAKSMFLRSHYLMERLLATDDFAEFKVPAEVLVD